jgi:hypothetical protein
MNLELKLPRQEEIVMLLTARLMPSARHCFICPQAFAAAVLFGILFTTQLVLGQTDRPAETKAEPVGAPDDAAKLHAEFAKLLTGCTMSGHFTVDGKSDALKEERYEVESVTKLPAGDLWLFKVRIRYGDHDVNVPLPLTVSWAGKTPVIVVDHLTIPGLGTFDARVVIADQRYAGTWQHGEVGGHLFGKVVTAEAKSEAADSQ